MTVETKVKPPADDKVQQPQVIWDDSKLRSSYANVCNVSSTREEVTLLFGTNQVWRAGQKEVTVELSNRVILNPFAAKRLAQLLNQVVGEYESRFGALGLGPEGPAAGSPKKG